MGGGPLRVPPQRVRQGVSPFIIAGNKKGNFVNKIALSLMTSVLAPLAVATAPAQAATFCVDFDFFCDGLELTTNQTAPLLSGQWVNWDCAGATAQVQGGFVVPDGSAYRVVCNTPDCPSAEDWLFTLSAFQAGFTFDLIQLDPPIVFQVNSPYTVTSGACAFTGSEKGSSPSWLQ